MARTVAGTRTNIVRTGSVLYNGDFESAPAVLTAPTTAATRWIDGTAAGSTAAKGLGWATTSIAGSIQVGWDNTVSHSGTYSMKLSTINTSGSLTIGTYTSTPNANQTFPLKASTTYKITGWIKTNNVASLAAFIEFREYTSAFATASTNSTNKLTGTNNFTQVTATITTQATTVAGTIFLRNNITGNIGDAWFDDIIVAQTGTLGRTTAGTRTVVT